MINVVLCFSTGFSDLFTDCLGALAFSLFESFPSNWIFILFESSTSHSVIELEGGNKKKNMKEIQLKIKAAR